MVLLAVVVGIGVVIWLNGQGTRRTAVRYGASTERPQAPESARGAGRGGGTARGRSRAQAGACAAGAGRAPAARAPRCGGGRSRAASARRPTSASQDGYGHLRYGNGYGTSYGHHGYSRKRPDLHAATAATGPATPRSPSRSRSRSAPAAVAVAAASSTTPADAGARSGGQPAAFVVTPRGRPADE